MVSEELNRKFNLPSVQSAEPKVPAKIDEEGETDFTYVRRSMADVVEMGIDGFKDLADLARSSQHPKVYEVMATYLKNLVEAQEKQLKIHETRKNLEKSGDAPTTVNNNLVLTTEQLDKLIESRSKKD